MMLTTNNTSKCFGYMNQNLSNKRFYLCEYLLAVHKLNMNVNTFSKSFDLAQNCLEWFEIIQDLLKMSKVLSLEGL